MPHIDHFRLLTAPLRATRALVARFNDHQGLQTTAALTYTTLFAVVPLTTVAYTLVAAIPDFQEVGDRMQQFIFEQFVPETGEVVLSNLREFAAQARGLTIVGVILLMITSIMMMITVETALNRIWQVRHRRHGVSAFLTWWAVLTLGPVMVGSAFLLSSWLASVTMLGSAAAWLGVGNLFLHFLPPLLSFLAFLLIFIIIPNARVRLPHAIVGAFFVSVALELAKWGFSLFFTHFPSYQVLYGAFAAVPLFLIWVFLSWAIILLGAEITAWLGESERADWRRWPPFWQRVGVLALLQRAWLEGDGRVSARAIRRRLGGRYSQLLAPLVERGWVVVSETDDWVLARSLEDEHLSTLVRTLPEPLPPLERTPPEYRGLAERLESARARYHEALETPLGPLLLEKATGHGKIAGTKAAFIDNQGESPTRD